MQPPLFEYVKQPEQREKNLYAVLCGQHYYVSTAAYGVGASHKRLERISLYAVCIYGNNLVCAVKAHKLIEHIFRLYGLAVEELLVAAEMAYYGSSFCRPHHCLRLADRLIKDGSANSAQSEPMP